MTETEQERVNSGVIIIPNGSHMSWVLPEKYLSLVEKNTCVSKELETRKRDTDIERVEPPGENEKPQREGAYNRVKIMSQSQLSC